MKKHLANIPLLMIITALIVTVSLAASIITGKWSWFAKSGGIVTIIGVILSIRPLMRKEFSERLASSSVIDGGHFPPTPEEIEEDKQSRLDAKASSIGTCMALVGTVISEYGELIESALP